MASRCSICCTENSGTYNILGTYLQAVYQIVTDLKQVPHKTLHVCFICNRRLQQFYEMQQLAKQNQTLYMENQHTSVKSSKTLHCSNSLVELTTSKVVNISIPWAVPVMVETEDGTSKVGQVKLELNEEQDTMDSKEDLHGHLFQENTFFAGDKGTSKANVEGQGKQISSLIMANVFSDNTNLTQYIKSHIEAKTANPTPFKCRFCEISFSNKLQLLRHTIAHTGDEMYSCDICEESFPNTKNLWEHKKKHTDKKLHMCNICKRSFTTKSNMRKHERLHTDDKPYGCDLCERSFFNETTLMKHKSIHTGEKLFACDLCEKSFARNVLLRLHKRIHTGEKPYSCDVCKRSFSCSSNLRKHERIHTGERPYRCDVCEKSFSHRSALNKHKTLHTGDQPIIYDVE